MKWATRRWTSCISEPTPTTSVPPPLPILLPFCTPVGWTLTAPSPVIGARGSTAANCSTNNPRTSDMAAFMEVYNRTNPAIRDAAGNLVPGGGAFHPRLPRFVNSEQDTERAGGSLSLQWRPNENTSLSLDGLLSRYQQERRDNYILGLSFGRNLSNNGQPMVSIKDVEFDDDGSMIYGLFDGVDVRSEGLVDQFVSKFEQLSLDMNHQFNDSFSVHAYAGRSINTWDGPLRFQTFMDAIDTDNFEVDFRNGGTVPRISFGFDVSNPSQLHVRADTGRQPDRARWLLAAGQAAAEHHRQQHVRAGRHLADERRVEGEAGCAVPREPLQQPWLESAEERHRHARVAGGHQHRGHHDPDQLVSTTCLVRARPRAGLPSTFTSGMTSSTSTVSRLCTSDCGAAQSKIFEDVSTGYLMFSFDSGDDWASRSAATIGVRYVMTDQFASGIIPTSAPATSIYTSFGQYNEVERDYNDTLPAFNVVFELTDNLLARLSGSKVMSRPELGNLSPTAGVTATTRTGNVNNPYLDPIRADTYDLGLEWYFSEGSLLSVAYFYKDIESYIQRITEQVPYRELGLPDSLLDGTPASPTDIFTVGRFQNTPGGPLSGFEINAQVQFSFLPSFWSDFGVLANYTEVDAEIEYFISATSAPVTNQLVGMSPTTAAGTLYFENETFSIRTTASYRDKYFRAIPASPGSDVRGDLSSTYVDAQASWYVTDNLTLMIEAQNLTGERSTLYIDDSRENTLFETEVGTTYTLGATYKF